MPYPESDLDVPATLTALIGSFWSATYGGSAQVQALCGGQGRLARQVYAALRETFDCLSLATVPTYHTEEWTALYIRQSQLTAAAPYRFDGSLTWDGAATFGVGGAPALQVPVACATVPLIVNRITDPSRALCLGLDYLVVDGALTFLTDPFADPRWGAQAVTDASGNVVDAEIVLWLFRAQFDAGFAADHFGYVFGLTLPSSDSYTALLQALNTALVSGASAAALDGVLAALTGVPAAAHDGETVMAVGVDSRGLLVVGSRQAYRLPGTANPLVSAGAVLKAGQPLCDAWQVFWLNRSREPGAALLNLAIGPGVLGPGYYSDIVWPNAEVALEVTTDGDGKTKVTWPLGGFPADVTAFWDAVHAAGTADGAVSLAHLLDVRGPDADEPTAASLPDSIVPMDFLIHNFLSANCFLVVVDAGALAANALGLYPLRLLRRVVPPHTCALIVVVLPGVSADFTVAGATLDPTTINCVYVEFENVLHPTDPVAVPPGVPPATRDYYEGLSGAPGRDYLRIGAQLTPSEAGFTMTPDTSVTFLAQSSGVRGVLGRPFDATANSKVCGLALVAAPVLADRTRDVVFARWYYPPALQQVKPAQGQFQSQCTLNFV
jgi:hypothetical protein